MVQKTLPVSLDLLIRRPDGSALLGQRTPTGAGFLVCSRRRVNKDETIAAALRRISLRELGVDLMTAAGLLGVYEHFTLNFAGADGVRQPTMSCWRIALKLRLILIKPADDQHDSLKWWKIEPLSVAADVHPYTQAYFQRNN
ncbi:MAG: GDP-mannose mannosyl hydrolase [Chitinivorax sp.]